MPEFSLNLRQFQIQSVDFVGTDVAAKDGRVVGRQSAVAGLHGRGRDASDQHRVALRRARTGQDGRSEHYGFEGSLENLRIFKRYA